MGIGVLVIGESATGKSTSMRNFGDGELFVFNVAGKPLPFRAKVRGTSNCGYREIFEMMPKVPEKTIAIDDAGYLLSFENFDRASENGYGKFVDMAVHFKKLLDCIRAAPPDTVVFVMMHAEYDANGRMKPKLIGKMLDEKLCVEGLFSIVLVAECREGAYTFATRTDGTTPAKTPIGMFEHERIPNDLKAVDTAIREYWELR